MAVNGYLEDPLKWQYLPLGEDVIISMYTYAIGLRLEDFSDVGEPFGVQWRGLPYPPQDLLSRGHSVIHSVKNDRQLGEDGIRQFFEGHRRSRCTK
jgi:hypothetical protein